MTDEARIRREANRTLSLLWRHHLNRTGGSRGPRPRISVDAVVRAAIVLADAEGLGFSLRQLAERLGLAPMSLYTYIPGRAELVALMIDEAAGESSRPPHDGDLRVRMSAVAHETWHELQRHPWLLHTRADRPWIGPHATRRYEWQLAALEGAGFSDLEMDQAVTLLTGFAESAARAAVGVSETRAASTLSDREWWEINAALLNRLISEAEYPIASRVGRVAGETYDSISDPELAFTFGLDRILDGLEALLDRNRQSGSVAVSQRVGSG